MSAKFSNKRRNIKGTNHGKKCFTPYKWYLDRKTIIDRKYKQEVATQKEDEEGK